MVSVYPGPSTASSPNPSIAPGVLFCPQEILRIFKAIVTPLAQVELRVN
jgi:hypothetical protein